MSSKGRPVYIPYAGFRSGTTIYDVGSGAWIAASSGDARIGVLFRSAPIGNELSFGEAQFAGPI